MLGCLGALGCVLRQGECYPPPDPPFNFYPYIRHNGRAQNDGSFRQNKHVENDGSFRQNQHVENAEYTGTFSVFKIPVLKLTGRNGGKTHHSFAKRTMAATIYRSFGEPTTVAAAVTITEPSRRRIIPGQQNVGFPLILAMAEALPASNKPELVRLAHMMISKTITPWEIGFSINLYIRADDGEKYDNLYNAILTDRIKAFDEGLYCHLLHKIASLIKKGHLARRDYLGVMRAYGTDNRWVRLDLYNDDMTTALFYANKNYGHTQNGDL